MLERSPVSTRIGWRASISRGTAPSRHRYLTDASARGCGANGFPTSPETPRHIGTAGLSLMAPRFYYLHPWIATDDGWDSTAEHAAALGFSHILLGWPFGSAEQMFATRSLDIIAGQPARDRLATFRE